MIKNSLYNTSGAALRLVLSILTIPLLIRLLGLEAYGLWIFVSTIVGFVALSEAGLSLSTTVFVARDLAGDDHGSVIQTLTITLSLIFLLASVAAICTLAATPALSALLPNISAPQRAEVSLALVWSGIVIWARLIQQVLVGLEQAYQRYDLLNLLQTAQTAALNIGWLAVAWFGGGVVWLMIWQAGVTLAFLLLHTLVSLRLLREVNLGFKWCVTKAKAIVNYSLATWVGILGTALFSQADRLIVGVLLGPASLGFYAAITSVTVQINVFSSMSIEPQFPVIAQMLVNKDVSKAEVCERVYNTMTLNVFGSLTMGALLLAGSSFILPALLPEASMGQLLSFRIAIIAYSLYSLNAVGTYVLFGADKVRLCSAVVIFSGVITLVLIVIGSAYAGLIGAMLGNLGYITSLAVYWFAMGKLDLPPWAWLGWIRLPLVCFLTAAGLSLLGAERIDLTPFIGTAVGCSIAGWFVLVQREAISQFFRDLCARRL